MGLCKSAEKKRLEKSKRFFGEWYVEEALLFVPMNVRTRYRDKIVRKQLRLVWKGHALQKGHIPEAVWASFQDQLITPEEFVRLKTDRFFDKKRVRLSVSDFEQLKKGPPETDTQLRKRHRRLSRSLSKSFSQDTVNHILEVKESDWD